MSRFLKHIRIDAFGAFSKKTVGPFSPGLNVVYGKNEAGKTTLASFVGGVLFGWEEARGTRNTYKPATSERAGALFFADTEAPDAEFELTRGRNADGLHGATECVADIDKKTYQTMFSLTSDELRSLNNTSKMTARLLTAGSGTGSSPAAALEEVQQRIAMYSSKAASAENSIVRINEELADVRLALASAAEQTERHKAEDREYHELVDERDDVSRRIRAINREIERLSVWKTRLEKLDEQREDLDVRRMDFESEMANAAAIDAAAETDISEQVLRMGASDERLLRDELDQMAEDQAKVARSIDIAQENRSNSQATYEALMEVSDDSFGRKARTTSVQIIVALIVSLAFVLVGVPVFMHARDINSLSITTMAIGIIAIGLIMAIVAFVSILRPRKVNDEASERRKNAQWVMLQDKKKLDAVMASKDELDDGLRRRLENAGLAGAQGSIRTARAMLDEAREVRAARRAAQQREAAFEMRSAKIQAAYDDIDLQRSRLAAESGLGDALCVDALEDMIDERAEVRDALIEESARTNARFGEVSTELAQAREMRDFDELKMRYQQLRCRLRDSEDDLVRLLLAQHMLARGISSWESRSQPEVYARASRLLAAMTQGVWVRVEMTSEGRMTVIDSMHNVREPRHLSLGTCQQLYLALRIALLMSAENVGRAIPVLADDILVNFDDDRRAGAAAALAELATKRQVIIFTCHKEVVSAICRADATCKRVEL